ncbi:MAG TPA: M4 family metallopeptidase [Holophagaceae bacterium]|nr:M4 family metallopeptidase [Holophagaceae bacterium]
MNTRVRAASALTMVLAGGALAAQAPTASNRPFPRTPEPASQVITEALLTRKSEFGMGEADGLKRTSAWVDAQGRTIARFHQTHRGARVFGSAVVGTLEPEGGVVAKRQVLESEIHLTGEPLLSGEQALRVSHREILPQGAYEVEPRAELVVFPTRYAGGLKAHVDFKNGMSWDRNESVRAPRPSASHVWAYEVVSVLNNAQDGLQELHVIVDARTGDVLRKWDAVAAFRPRTKASHPRTYADLERASAPWKVAPAMPRPMAAPMAVQPGVASSQPALGTGHSQYNGDVTIGTSTNPTGGFDLRDQTRAMNPANPNSVWLTTGIVTNYIDIFQSGITAHLYNLNTPDGLNIWGDGQNYQAPSPYLPNEAYTPALFHWTDANGQTAAVDAHFAATNTYDMYRDVLGRPGMDGNDAGLFSIVHYSYLFDNAAWVDSYKMMIYGDGSYPYGGFKSMTALDVGGHEMSHGVMARTAALDYHGESGGLNEANSDMMSQAVVAYSQRAPGDPIDRIPAVATPWAIGAQLTPDGQPFRSMVKPSVDGYSPDARYYGMGMLDVHYTSGPGNRFFYYLSEGAPAQSSALAFSPYLPQGMTGIGLDKATRIWYKALSEQFTHTTDYYDARRGALAAAAELYGAASTEVAAVENAFAAINVGPAHGASPRPLVTFPENLIAAGSPLDGMTQGTSYEGVYSRTLIVPAHNVCDLKVNVANATDTRVTWTAGLYPGFWSPANTPMDATSSNGSFDDQGRYHSPVVAPLWCGVKATSKQDPLEFAAGMVFVARMDADGDAEEDALDGGMLALIWNLKKSVVDQISPMPDPEGIGVVDDVSVQLWREAFKNAFEK